MTYICRALNLEDIISVTGLSIFHNCIRSLKIDGSEGEAKFLSVLQGVSPLRSPAAVFVGAAALLKSSEKKDNKLFLSGFQILFFYSSARLQPSSHVQLIHDNWRMILSHLTKLHDNLL